MQILAVVNFCCSTAKHWTKIVSHNSHIFGSPSTLLKSQDTHPRGLSFSFFLLSLSLSLSLSLYLLSHRDPRVCIHKRRCSSSLGKPLILVYSHCCASIPIGIFANRNTMDRTAAISSTYVCRGIVSIQHSAKESRPSAKATGVLTPQKSLHSYFHPYITNSFSGNIIRINFLFLCNIDMNVWIIYIYDLCWQKKRLIL